MANSEVLKNLLGASYKEGMTPDEVVKAINELETNPFSKMEEENKNLKTRLSEVNSESANYKKQLRAKQTEEEKKQAEHEEQFQKMTEELETLKHEKVLAETTAKFASLGFGDDAGTAADSFLKGDLSAFTSTLTTRSEHEKDALKAELMQTTKRPEAGNAAGKKMTKQELYKMSFEDRMRFIREHKAEYDEITKE